MTGVSIVFPSVMPFQQLYIYNFYVYIFNLNIAIFLFLLNILYFKHLITLTPARLEFVSRGQGRLARRKLPILTPQTTLSSPDSGRT